MADVHSKSDNRLNNIADQVAWDQGKLNFRDKRIFIDMFDGSIKVNITRRPNGISEKNAQWTMEDDLKDCLDKFSKHHSVFVILTDLRLVVSSDPIVYPSEIGLYQSGKGFWRIKHNGFSTQLLKVAAEYKAIYKSL